MKITCPSCDAKYSIADEKVQGKVAKIRCKKCGATIVVGGQGSEAAASAPDQPAAAASGASYTVSVSDSDQRTMTLAELVDAYNTGVVTGETYVWADGMDDWQPIASVPDILSALQGGAPAPMGSLQLPEPPPPSEPHPAPVAAAAPAAARRDAGKAKAVDLFGGASAAGAEEAPASRRSNPPMGGGGGGDNLTGARNEQSVLFSLNALANAASQSRPSSPGGGPSTTTAKSSEDSGLIDLGALAKAAAEQPAHASPAMSPMLGAPMLGGPMLGAPDLSAPATASATMPPPKKGNTGMIIGGAIVVAAALIAVVIVVTRPKDQPAPASAPPTTSAPAAATTPAADATASAAPTSTAVDPTATPSASAKVAAVPGKGGPLPKPGDKPGKPDPGTAKTPDPPATPPKPAGGGGSPCGCAPSDLMCNMACASKKPKKPLRRPRDPADGAKIGREHHCLEQRRFVDELEAGCISVQHDHSASVFEPDAARAIDRCGEPEALGQRRRRGAVGHAAQRAQALAELDAAHLFERIGHHVAVDAGAQPHARLAQRADVRVPVAEIALGGGVDARVSARFSKHHGLVGQQVRRVNGDETRSEHAMIGEQLDRAPTRLGDAGVDLAGLLGDVHVQRQLVATGVLGDGREPRRRNGANAVRRDAHAHVWIVRVPSAQRIDVGERDVARGIGEAALRPLGRSTRASAVIHGAQERDAQTFVLGRSDHRVGHHRAIVVRRAVRLVVQVVELAHRQRPGLSQLAVGDARDRVHLLGRHRLGQRVHRRAPRPEIVGSVRPRALRLPTHRALESVRVRRREGRQPHLAVDAQDFHTLSFGS